MGTRNAPSATSSRPSPFLHEITKRQWSIRRLFFTPLAVCGADDADSTSSSARNGTG